MTKVGVINKTRGRIILPAIVQRIPEQTVYLEVVQYMQENLELHPGYLFSHIPVLLMTEELRPYLLGFI